MEKQREEIKKDLRRSFGGKLSGFKDRAEALHEQKHLRAYIRGDKRFQNGMTGEGQRVPDWFKVEEVWS